MVFFKSVTKNVKSQKEKRYLPICITINGFMSRIYKEQKLTKQKHRQKTWVGSSQKWKDKWPMKYPVRLSFPSGQGKVNKTVTYEVTPGPCGKTVQIWQCSVSEDVEQPEFLHFSRVCESNQIGKILTYSYRVEVCVCPTAQPSPLPSVYPRGTLAQETDYVW